MPVGSTGGSTAPGTTARTTTDGAKADAEGLPSALGSARAVRTAVEAVLTSGDPAEACGRYVTEGYLKRAYGGKHGCVEAQQPGSAAASLRSFRIEQEGGQGGVVGASAVPRGGPYDGTKLRIGLVFSADHYRVDILRSNVPVGP